jgi:hypothetical protein
VIIVTVSTLVLYLLCCVSNLAGIEDPNFFFKAIMAKPYAQNIIWGPHFYAQSVIPFPLPKRFMEVRLRHVEVLCLL